MKPENDRLDEELYELGRAVTGRPSVADRVRDRIGQLPMPTASRNPFRRTVMQGRLLRIAASILVVGGIVAVLMVLNSNQGNKGVAFADMVEPLIEARTATYTVTAQGHDTPEVSLLGMYMAPGKMRLHGTENGQDFVKILDLERGLVLTLMPDHKWARLIEIKNMGEDKTVMAGFLNLREIILCGVAQEKCTIDYLGEKEVEGAEAIGYVVHDTYGDATIWARSSDYLPIRVEWEGVNEWGYHVRAVMADFEFDVELDESLFSMEIPDEYESSKYAVELAKPSEETFLNALQMWADFTGEAFPMDVDMRTMEEFQNGYARTHGYTWEDFRDPNSGALSGLIAAGVKMQQGVAFIRGLPATSGWRYVGMGVESGDSKSEVFWYQPEGSGKYRVVYGDLHVEEVEAEELPDYEAMMDSKWLTLTCRRLEAVPEVDGSLADEAWAGEADIAEFVDIWGNDEVSVGTQAWVGYDDENLYVAFSCAEPEPGGMKLATTEDDNVNVCGDDSVEVFIDSNSDRSTFFQIIISAAGVAYDGRNGDKSWEGDYTFAWSRNADNWVMEMAIPWATVEREGPPGEAERIGFNLMRNRPRERAEYMQWARTYTHALRPELFGRLRF